MDQNTLRQQAVPQSLFFSMHSSVALHQMMLLKAFTGCVLQRESRGKKKIIFLQGRCVVDPTGSSCQCHPRVSSTAPAQIFGLFAAVKETSIISHRRKQKGT